MPGFTPFTRNYTDLSDENGYQFEFRCDHCGSGYRSEFIRSGIGTAGSVLSGASNLLGGLWGASNAARNAKDFVDRDARDDALEKAANEIMPLFTRCAACSAWVDETCFNRDRNLCTSCAPNLAAEMERERSSVEMNQMREAMQARDRLLRRHVGPADGLPVLRQAGRVGEVLRQLRDAARDGALHPVRGGAADRRPVLRQLRDEDRRLSGRPTMPPGVADLPTYAGQIRRPGGDAAPGTVTLDETAVIIVPDGAPPRTVAYRDLAVLAITGGVGLVATGAGPEAERWLLERFGAAAGPAGRSPARAAAPAATRRRVRRAARRRAGRPRRVPGARGRGPRSGGRPACPRRLGCDPRPARRAAAGATDPAGGGRAGGPPARGRRHPRRRRRRWVRPPPTRHRAPRGIASASRSFPLPPIGTPAPSWPGSCPTGVGGGRAGRGSGRRRSPGVAGRPR